jgi:hypothetical protein
MKHDLNPSAIYWASFNRFSIRMPGEAVQDIAQSGSNDEAVEHWFRRVELGRDIFGRLQATPENIREELKEYGAWDAEQLADDEENLRRIVWIAAHNIAEDETPDCSEPLVQSCEVGPFRVYGI